MLSKRHVIVSACQELTEVMEEIYNPKPLALEMAATILSAGEDDISESPTDSMRLALATVCQERKMHVEDSSREFQATKSVGPNPTNPSGVTNVVTITISITSSTWNR
jgi:hypothetical protein